jgi:hypothetical protein
MDGAVSPSTEMTACIFFNATGFISVPDHCPSCFRSQIGALKRQHLDIILLKTSFALSHWATHRCAVPSAPLFGGIRGPSLSLFLDWVFLYYALMVKSILVIRKRRGRPATGQHPIMAVRLPQELIERIDEWMKACNARSRSDAIRRLIELGLDRSAVKTRQPKRPRQHRST